MSRLVLRFCETTFRETAVYSTPYCYDEKWSIGWSRLSKPIDDFNHIDENISEIEIPELKALYRHYHKRYWLYKMVYKYFKKVDLACSISSVALFITGSITGGYSHLFIQKLK